MRPIRSIGVTAGALLVVVALVAPAAGTALVPNPTLDQTGKGLTIAEAGVGLADLGNGTKNISITIGGPVQKAFLYWAGRQSGPCANLSCLAGRDQTLVFDGTPVAGTQTGTEQGTAEFTNVGYKADVTAIVAAKGGGAAKTFTIADGDALDLTVPSGAGLNGAGLFVIYRNLADNGTYRVMVYEGLDFAWHAGATLELRTTTPVVFNHGATTTSRNAQVVVFAGDASAARPDRITVNGTSFNNLLDASPDGPQWDTELIPVTIAANVASTTVQLFSDPPPAVNSDSLLWQLGALRIPVPAQAAGCFAGPHGTQSGTDGTNTDEDNDTNDGGTPNNVPDTGDNAHPSGKDRSIEHGKSNNQGKTQSDPDGDVNGGVDQPDGAGGDDLADQDGNNGCGNDDDFEDDNNANSRPDDSGNGPPSPGTTTTTTTTNNGKGGGKGGGKK